MVRYIGLWVIVVAFSSFTNKMGDAANLSKQPNRLRTIVIDPGHGGHDTGAPGKYSYEKDIVLAISLKLQQALKNEFSDINVVLTRTTDRFDSPQEKAQKANDAKGDLFISIHCNSANPIQHKEITGYKTIKVKGKKKKKVSKKVPVYRHWTTPNPATGTETYIWGIHKQGQKELAMKENEALYLDSTMAKEVEDFDPDSPQKRILYSLKTQQYFIRSANLALTIEDEFTKIGRLSREARQRQVGIWVLQATAMPSVLIETGFISNPDEEDYLNSEQGQQQLVGSMINAIKRYKYSLENQTLQTVIPDTGGN